jgi:hypothetical protein
MQNSTRDSLRKAFFEAFFVVFGVVLALAANEWRQNAAAERRAARALADIEAELAANREMVAASREYHWETVTMLGDRMKAGEPVYPRDFTRGFIWPALVENTAWEVAKETGSLSEMDYSRVLELSAVYGAQDRYRTQAETVGGMIYQRMLDGGIEAVTEGHKNLISIIYTFVYREQELLDDYAAVLDGVRDEEDEPETDDGSVE